ncbi:hypothetical protein PAMP_012594 [Pampus punctatissimus]
MRINLSPFSLLGNTLSSLLSLLDAGWLVVGQISKDLKLSWFINAAQRSQGSSSLHILQSSTSKTLETMQLLGMNLKQLWHMTEQIAGNQHQPADKYFNKVKYVNCD